MFHDGKGFAYVGSWLKSYSGDAETLAVPKGVTRIKAFAFSIAKNLKRIVIPETVTRLETHSFGFERFDVEIAADNPKYAVIGGCVVDKTERKLLYSARAVEIPADERVSVVCSHAFMMRRDITRMTVPDNITTIENGAFDCCSEMTEIFIPASVEKIDQAAFSNCKSLRKITVDKDNREYCMRGNCLTEKSSGTLIYACVGCEIPEDIKVFGRAAFGHGHTSLYVPRDMTAELGSAFCGCDTLKTLTVHKDNPTYYSVDDCIIARGTGKLVLGCENSVIPSDGSVTVIDNGAFACCFGLTRIVLPQGIACIGPFAFNGCKHLREIVLPETLEEIGYYAFECCAELETVVLPSHLKRIGNSAFDYCDALMHITIPASVTEIGEDALGSYGTAAGRTVEFEDKTGWTENGEPIDVTEAEFDGHGELIKVSA